MELAQGYTSTHILTKHGLVSKFGREVEVEIGLMEEEVYYKYSKDETCEYRVSLPY